MKVGKFKVEDRYFSLSATCKWTAMRLNISEEQLYVLAGESEYLCISDLEPSLGQYLNFFSAFSDWNLKPTLAQVVLRM